MLGGRQLGGGRRGSIGTKPAAGNFSDSKESAARKYLDANCGYCHNPNGFAASSGLHLDLREMNERRLGFCKTPVAAPMPEEWGVFDIEPREPSRSLVVRRMMSMDPLFAMPELGRSSIDVRGVAIVSGWISELQGSCDDVVRGSDRPDSSSEGLDG
ncbi:MAG: hypothetical protein IPK00_23565 [Deltaproteobacteria bacterium]|nr:hypothetical protein [Deltaproteobacteria bacterium]